MPPSAYNPQWLCPVNENAKNFPDHVAEIVNKLPADTAVEPCSDAMRMDAVETDGRPTSCKGAPYVLDDR
jgi:hypothetical protein